MLAFGFGASRGAPGHSYRAPLCILGLAFLRRSGWCAPRMKALIRWGPSTSSNRLRRSIAVERCSPGGFRLSEKEEAPGERVRLIP